MRTAARAARADIERYIHTRCSLSLRTLNAIVMNYGLQATLVYRLGRTLLAHRTSPLYWPLLVPGWVFYGLCATLVHWSYGIRLELSADIGPGLYIGHFGGIEVMNCKIGQHCSINAQCKLGRKSEKSGPEIGDRVWIGGHVHLFGPLKIGNQATIAAGSRIAQDVAPRSLVIGNPGRVVSRNYDNSGFLL